MNFTSVPIIVISCYVIGEIYKFIFRNKDETYKFIPVLSAAILLAQAKKESFPTAKQTMISIINIPICPHTIPTVLRVAFNSGLSPKRMNRILESAR